MGTGNPRLAQHFGNTHQSDLNNTSNKNQVQQNGSYETVMKVIKASKRNIVCNAVITT